MADHPDSRQRELGLQLGLGAALSGIRGYGAAEIEQVYVRAVALARQVGDVSKHADALFGLGLWSLVRGRIRATHEWAVQLSSLQSSDAGLFAARAQYLFSAATFFRGRSQEAWQMLQPEGAGGAAEPPPGSAPSRVRIDASHWKLGSAHGLWVCGHAERAMEQIDVGLEAATALKNTRWMASALNSAALLHQLNRSYPASLACAGVLHELAEKNDDLVHFEALAAMFRAQALVEAGQLLEGLEALEDARPRPGPCCPSQCRQLRGLSRSTRGLQNHHCRSSN